MVYEVALLYRTREAFLATGDARGGVRTGLRADGRRRDRRGRGDARGGRSRSPRLDLLSVQVFGVGVAIAILIDALVVRPVLLPAAVALLGRWCWWPLSRQAPPTPPRTPEVSPSEKRAPTGDVPVGV